jgi:hypothetical protein
MAIKVRVLRGVQVGLSGMSGLVAVSTAVTACTATPPPGDDAVSSESNLTVADPGTGVISLAWDYATPIGYSMSAKNSTDEYVRAGEKMTFSLPAHFLWQRLYPSLPLPNDVSRLKQLTAQVKITSIKDSAVYASSNVTTNGSFEGSQIYDLAALTTSFIVDAHAHSIRFEITIGDAADATKSAVSPTDLNKIAVFGGAIPNKTALFDSLGPTMRQRIVEGGKPVAGANLDIVYTDWRAATLNDVVSIDKTIGNATSYGRFGSFQMPINGDLEYEITYGAAIDGVWTGGEQTLIANAKSRLLPPYGRVGYEGTLAVPAGAGHVELYFHVKTFLVVSYGKFSNVGWRKYADGARILVREKWDNDHGVYAANYDFPTELK